MRSLDYTTEDPREQSQRTMKEYISQKAMSAQVVLSYDTPCKRDIPSKLAWIFLNVRLVNASVAQTVGQRNVQMEGLLILTEDGIMIADST